MRKFLITSPNYEGAAELIFRPDGTLIKIDTSNCNMNWTMTSQFKARVPEHVNLLEDAYKSTTATVVEADYRVSLEDFTREYPYKRNSHLLPAIWARMSVIDQIKAVSAAADYRKHCHREKEWYKPKIAASWLKEKEYLNDWKSL